MTAAALLDAVWGGLHSLCRDDPNRPKSFRTVGIYDDPAELLAAAKAESDAGMQLWFGVHPLRQRPDSGRGGNADVAELRVLVADLDWDDEYAHQAEPGSLPTEAEVRARLAAFPYPPTFTVNSGHGIQAYWRLAVPVTADAGHALTLRLHAALEAAGLPADRDDLASVLRLPGSFNRKPGCDEVPVTIEQTTDAVYQPEYLDKQLPAARRDTPERTSDGAIALDDGNRLWWAEGDIGQGKRHHSLVAAAGWCRAAGLFRHEARPIIRDVLARHKTPRHTLDDAIAVLDDIYSRYPDRGALAERRGDIEPPDSGDELEVIGVADLCAEIADAPPPGYLVRQLIPQDSYGVLGAEKKAGKTWATLDLAVSVASATPWLGIYPVDRPGLVLAFLGEGGKRKMHRRLAAITEQRDLELAELPLRLSFKAPHLTSADAIAAVRQEIDLHPPALVIIDPLYLAARGANASQLNEMGAHLETIQHVCQDAGAALLIVHHWNKTGAGTGAGRMSGAGVAEWGRFLISMSVLSKRSDPDGRSTVTVRAEVEGDELAEQDFRYRRTIWVDDPEDLTSPMHYLVEHIEDDEPTAVDDNGFSPATKRVLAVLELATDWLKVSEIGDRLADEGRPLKKRTIQTSLNELRTAGLADAFGTDQKGTPWSWRTTVTTTATGATHVDF